MASDIIVRYFARSSESDPAHANQRRPIRRPVRRLARGIDVLSLLQLWERESARDQAPPVVQQLIQRAVQQELVVPGLGIFHVSGDLGIERRGAVSGQRVIPLRMISQLIQVVGIDEEYLSRPLR